MYNTAYIHFGGMKFKVVQCPRCKKAKGVRMDAKTSSCPRCGSQINLTKAKILCEAESEKDLVKAVMKYNTEIEGGEREYTRDMKLANHKDNHHKVEYKSSDIYDIVIKNLRDIKGRDKKIEAAAINLCSQLTEFTEEDLNEVLKRIGIVKDEGCSQYIDKLMEINVIYQPKSGVYRCLE
jgi:RNA recognition motif-containing protein